MSTDHEINAELEVVNDDLSRDALRKAKASFALVNERILEFMSKPMSEKIIGWILLPVGIFLLFFGNSFITLVFGLVTTFAFCILF